MARVLLTEQAEADLADIWSDIAEHSERAADRLINDVRSRCESLADHPYKGRARNEIAPTIRSTTVGDYLVLHRVTGDVVTVLRVVHGARDIARQEELAPKA